jgi:hypothetical protein
MGDGRVSDNFTPPGDWTMVTDAQNGLTQKYGRRNCSIMEDGGDIVIRIDTKGMVYSPSGSACLAGTPNPTKDNPDKKRVVNLVGSSGGFDNIGGLKVSVNVTSEG